MLNRFFKYESYLISSILSCTSIYYLSNLQEGFSTLQKVKGVDGTFIIVNALINNGITAVYFLLAAIILLLSGPIKRRFLEFFPNVIALFGSFLPFLLLPAADILATYIGVPLIVLGIGITISLFSLANLRTAFSITPQAKYFVSSGIYSFIRHPMYLGSIISIVGLIVLKSTVIALVVGAICIILQISRARS